MTVTTPPLDRPFRSADGEPASELRDRPILSDRPARRAAPAPALDEVDAWGDSSFPASDPPGWWAGP
jgi:hypothetical protein